MPSTFPQTGQQSTGGGGGGSGGSPIQQLQPGEFLETPAIDYPQSSISTTQNGDPSTRLMVINVDPFTLPPAML
jgi:hypothetical protein